MNKSYSIIMVGLLSMIVASAIYYFDLHSASAYILFPIGFILVGVGILAGFIKMVSEDKN